MNEITYKKAMAILEELRKVINEAADGIESAKRERGAKAA